MLKVAAMKIIEDWHEKELTCAHCGGTYLVKYARNWKAFCDTCLFNDIETNPIPDEDSYRKTDMGFFKALVDKDK